jgi:hypothetical protein
VEPLLAVLGGHIALSLLLSCLLLKGGGDLLLGVGEEREDPLYAFVCGVELTLYLYFKPDYVLQDLPVQL